MKNHDHRHPTPQRRTTPTPRNRQPTTDALQRETTQRRLYADFLALAFYPGMQVAEPPTGRASAA